MKIKLLVVGLLSIFLVSCEDSGVVPQKITVNGTVGFDFGFAENYKIEINGKTATSDINGNFSFENVDIPTISKFYLRTEMFLFINLFLLPPHF